MSAPRRHISVFSSGFLHHPHGVSPTAHMNASRFLPAQSPARIPYHIRQFAPLSECINNKMRIRHRNKIVLIAVLGFCLLELLDWTGITRGGFPSDWRVALLQVCVNIGWTAFATTVAYLTMMRPDRRPTLPEDGLSPSQTSDKQRSKSDSRVDAEH